MSTINIIFILLNFHVKNHIKYVTFWFESELLSWKLVL